MNVKDYWIDEIKNIEEFKEIGSTEDTELSLLQSEIVDLIDDQFIETATEAGIAKREKILKIQTFADDTTESRRFRIKAMWNNKGPYTYNKLVSKLNNLVGAGGYVVTLNHNAYTLTVTLNLGVKRQLIDAENMVKNIVPANLIISVDLQYNRHSDLAAFTHAHLASYTHEQLRSEVIS